jgi:hypothetical protein
MNTKIIKRQQVYVAANRRNEKGQIKKKCEF